ncbi:hypothetical protein EMIT0373P_30365 [Pseudomonas chlororaphis]
MGFVRCVMVPSPSFLQTLTDNRRNFRGIKGTTPQQGGALFSPAGRWSFLGQVDQILSDFLGTRSAHTNQRPR